MARRDRFKIGDRVEARRSEIILPDHPKPKRYLLQKGDRGWIIKISRGWAGQQLPYVHWDAAEQANSFASKAAWLRVISPLELLAEQAE